MNSSAMTTAETEAARCVRLAIDVGNTRTKLGLFICSSERGVLPVCVRHAVVMDDQPVPWDTLLSWQRTAAPWRMAVMAGSNPHGVARIQTDWPSTLGPPPQHITNSADFPLAIHVDEPRRVGIDRLLNAVAINALREPACSAIVVDSGTATTVDCVSREGAFEGGAILPGLALSAKALHQYTALLPQVSVAELGERHPEAVGRNTRAAICSGLFWGQLGAVRELISRQAGEAAELFITGGGGALLTEYLPKARFEPHLALQGLVLVADQAEHAPMPSLSHARS